MEDDNLQLQYFFFSPADGFPESRLRVVTVS
jgi:hypothetical protein